MMHVIAGKAVAFREAMTPQFAAYQRQVVENAQVLAEALLAGGLRLVSGGTDNHLILADVGSKGLSGKKAERLLDAANITVNKNTIPFDTRSPTIGSGVRIGTPALTTRGFGPEEMRRVAAWILRVLDNPNDEAEQQRVGAEVREMASAYPVPGIA